MMCCCCRSCEPLPFCCLSSSSLAPVLFTSSMCSIFEQSLTICFMVDTRECLCSAENKDVFSNLVPVPPLTAPSWVFWASTRSSGTLPRSASLTYAKNLSGSQPAVLLPLVFWFCSLSSFAASLPSVFKKPRLLATRSESDFVLLFIFDLFTLDVGSVGCASFFVLTLGALPSVPSFSLLFISTGCLLGSPFSLGTCTARPSFSTGGTFLVNRVGGILFFLALLGTPVGRKSVLTLFAVLGTLEPRPVASLICSLSPVFAIISTCALLVFRSWLDWRPYFLPTLIARLSLFVPPFALQLGAVLSVPSVALPSTSAVI